MRGLLFASTHLLANDDYASILFLERLLFLPSLGGYLWTKGAGWKLTQNGRFSWIKPPGFHLRRSYAADCGSRWPILAG
jgi:hypothetical protein